MGLVALSVGISIALSARSREDRLSCHLCRARKEVRVTSLFGRPLSHRETVSYPGRSEIGHVHDWWPYSDEYRNGLGGCLGSGVACKADRYRDGSLVAAPAR